MSIPAINRPPAVPKGVVWFGILLTLSLALLGLLASYLVNSLNGDYQEIVNRQLPSLAIVRKISQTNANGRRMVESLSNSPVTVELEEVKAKLNAIREENSIRLERLRLLLDKEEGRALVEALLERRMDYRDSMDQFFKDLSHGMDSEKRESWRLKISVLDKFYAEAQDNLADYCSRTAEERGDALAHRSRKLTGLFLIVAAWPLVLAVCSFLSGLISTLVFFFRNRA
jgi:uncharacterized protein YdiU (UPF0061 family)